MPLSVLPSASDERNAQITIGPTKKQRYYTHRDASGSDIEGTPPMQTMESVDARDRRAQNMHRGVRTQVAGSAFEKDSEGQLITDISEDSAKSTRQFKTLHYLITRKTKASKVKYRRRSKPKTPKPTQAKAATGASTRKPVQSTSRDYPPKGASTVDGHVPRHSSQIHAQVQPTTSERLLGDEGLEQDDDPNSLYSATLKVLRKHPKWNVETMLELRKAVVATVWPEPERQKKNEEHNTQLDLADYDIVNPQMQGISYSRPAPPTSLPHHEPVPKKPPLPPYVLGRTQGPPLYVPPPDAQPIPPQTYSYVGPTFSRMPHPQSRSQPAQSRVTSNVSNASTDRSSMYSDHTTRTYPALSRRNPPPQGSNTGASHLQHADFAARSSQQQALQNASTLFPNAMQPPRPTHTYTLPPSFQAPPLPQFHPSLQPANQPHLMKPPPPLRPTQQVVAYSTTLLPPPIPQHPVSHARHHSTTDHIPSLPPIEESPPRKNIVARSEPVAKAAEKPQPTQSIKRLDAIKLGGLGPDTSNEEYIAKLDKYHKQKHYAQQVRMLARSLLHKQQNSTRPSSRGSMTSQNSFATVSSKPRSHTARAATNPLSVKYAPKDVEAAAMKRRKMQSYAASIPKPAQSAPTRNQLRRQSVTPDSDDDEYFERRKAESELRKLEEEHQKGVVAVESIRREMGL
ncbi:hypothetical protein HDU85_003391 [Gaertneriomyces sp. JEL0708]|nr:hypothetical protein HDU85_003391 [Gaertneriomyces sp. JEL0708]